MANQNRLSDAEARALLDRLFPLGVAGSDVLEELAPAGWDQSPLLACFHPSTEQIREESRKFQRNLESLQYLLSRRTGTRRAEVPPPAEPAVKESTIERATTPVKPTEEIRELVGLCLWDVFSDNHEVITADGRVADIGSFRGASEFLDQYLTGSTGSWSAGDYLRFYMGTAWISQRADLEPVYAMIFRRLRAVGGDWAYAFPRLRVVDLGGHRRSEKPYRYSPNEALAEERAEAARQARLTRLRQDLDEADERAREAAMDRRPPMTVMAYRSVFGSNPRGWPPAS